MSAVSQPNQRNYARIETRIAVRFRRVEENEITAFAETVIAGEAGEEELPAALVARLRAIDHKLQLVLSLLDPRHRPPLDPELDQRDVVLSAGGIRIEAAAGDLESGAHIALEMLLPGDSPRSVQAIACVTRVDDAGDATQGIACEYQLIDEADRDAIVRLVNRLQVAAAARRAKGVP
jgi:hypothetical protein